MTVGFIEEPVREIEEVSLTVILKSGETIPSTAEYSEALKLLRLFYSRSLPKETKVAFSVKGSIVVIDTRDISAIKVFAKKSELALIEKDLNDTY